MIGQLFSEYAIVKLDPISTTLPIKIRASPTMKNKFHVVDFWRPNLQLIATYGFFQESLKGKTTRMIDGGSIR